ncbi:MAG: hypothetical protein KME44_11695, partial [Candidatus Thiodiazotropha sp. (ex Lucina pensylvanica)]|nr:hypothetical protein [Candidatus Thiodiazotropha sp. (ex Lucina pensylvanica)]
MSEVTNKLKVEKRIPWPGQSEGWWLGLLDSGLRRNDVQLEYPISALPDLTPSVVLSANCHRLTNAIPNVRLISAMMSSTC